MSMTDLGVALVTGASSGIGRATAQALQRAGYRVFGTSRSVRPSMEVRNGVAEADAPEVVAATVVKAATAAAPRRRYAAGRLARQVRIMRRLVPESAFDKSLRKHNHLPVRCRHP